jgi:hypothetical protein
MHLEKFFKNSFAQDLGARLYNTESGDKSLHLKKQISAAIIPKKKKIIIIKNGSCNIFSFMPVRSCHGFFFHKTTGKF